MSTHMKYSIRRSQYLMDKWCPGRDGFPLYADVMRKIRSKLDNAFQLLQSNQLDVGCSTNNWLVCTVQHYGAVEYDS